MTRRAALLMDALADGPLSRRHIFDRTGFMLLNNAAAELRAAGATVDCDLVDGEYVYTLVSLLDEPGHDDGAGEPSPDFPEAGLVEQADGQLVFA